MPSADEHRYHSRLKQHWDSIRGDRAFPREQDVNPEAIRDIWDSCFLICIDDVTRRVGYRYSYMGQHLVEAYGNDEDNAEITLTLKPTDNALMVRHFNDALQTRQPVLDEAEFVNRKHIPIRYRSCILPLGTEDGTITHLLGCMRWKMY
jgi:hypothetical protein